MSFLLAQETRVKPGWLEELGCFSGSVDEKRMPRVHSGLFGGLCWSSDQEDSSFGSIKPLFCEYEANHFFPWWDFEGMTSFFIGGGRDPDQNTVSRPSALQAFEPGVPFPHSFNDPVVASKPQNCFPGVDVEFAPILFDA